MKICHLSFDNLNSLGGHFELDLTHASLTDGGIFVICGPTGSGKTTLLDAITYALYGQTVRQGKLTAASNEIMTHGARFCRAEVTVEKNGQHYLFSTEQRRKKTRSAKADPYTTAERRASLLAADGTATLLSADVNGVRQVADGLMKYENFCRCMMLAQGDFARFLKAEAAERSEALATITGTGIYQRIGETVQERVAALKATLAAAALLPTKTPEERAAAEARRDACAATCKAQQAALDALHQALAWHEGLARAATTRAQRQQALERVQAEQQQWEAAGNNGRLRAAEAALAIRPQEMYATTAARAAAATRQQQQQEQQWLAEHPGTGLSEAAEAAAAALAQEQAALEARGSFLADTAQPLEEAIGKATIRAKEAARTAATCQKEAEAAATTAQNEQKAAQNAAEEQRAATAALAALPPLHEAEAACTAAQERAELAYKIQSVSGKLAELYREFCAGKLPCCPCCGSPEPHNHPQQNEGELARARQQAKALSEALTQQRQQQQQATARLAAATSAHAAAQKAATAAGAEAERRTSLHAEAARRAAEAAQALAHLQAQLAEHWQGGSVREAERSLRAELQRLQDACTRSKDALHAYTREREAHAALAAAAGRQLPAQEAAAAQAAATFAAALQEHAFADAATYTRALLPARELDALRQKAAELRQRRAEAEGALQQAAAQEEELRQQNHSPDTPESLAQQRDTAAALLHEQKELLTAVLAELRQDDDAHRANAEQEARLAGTRTQLAHWQRLYEVLGNSRDGFKKYAQRITFNLLLRQANLQLRQLSDRYTLLQDNEKELGLRVLDRYQDDAQGRACSNLSGGESFIVSLALALGLSRMAGETRIDTLFMDEGFGTLDENALEQVLACLQRLRADGKLIGIISHVETLKERITARLELLPRGVGGLSTIAPHEAVVAQAL